VTEGEESEEY